MWQFFPDLRKNCKLAPSPLIHINDAIKNSMESNYGYKTVDSSYHFNGIDSYGDFGSM